MLLKNFILGAALRCWERKFQICSADYTPCSFTGIDETDLVNGRMS